MVKYIKSTTKTIKNTAVKNNTNKPSVKLTKRGEFCVANAKTKTLAKGAEGFATYFNLYVWPEPKEATVETKKKG